MTFTHEFRQSGAWRQLKAHIEARLDVYRRRNDSGLNEIETAKLRGRIAELKLLLSDVEPTDIHTTREDQA